MEGVTGRRQTKSAAVVPPVRGPRGKPVESRRGPATVAGQPVPRSHSQACGEGGTARSARSLQTREPGNLPGGAKCFHLFERKRGAPAAVPRLPALPATILDRMIVSRGVLGAQFGAGALGGVVELLPRAARGTWAGGAEASVGSFGTERLALDAAMPVGNGSALLAVQGDRTSGDFEYARQRTPEIPGSPYFGFTRENADATRGSGLLRISQ